MQILLVSLHRDPGERMFPLELAGIGAALKARGHEVAALDLDVDRRRPFHRGDPKGDAIVLTACCDTWPRVREHLKGIIPDPQRCIAVGGTQATLFPDEVLAQPAVDAVFRGEGEHVLGRLLEAWQNRSPESIPGVLWHQRHLEAGMKSQAGSQRIEDLDGLGDADRTLFRIDAYTGMATRRARYTQIVATRGRDRHSRYDPLDRLLPGGRRSRSVGRVVEEMAATGDRFGIGEFHFEDDGLFEDAGYVRELCKAIRLELPGIVWQCPAGNHPDDLSAELLDAMAAAGCYRVYVEPHSPRPAAMELLGWSWDPERLGRLAAHARRVGIELGGYFTLGLPDESAEQMQATTQFAVESDLAWAQFTPFRFVPGSALWDGRDDLARRRPAERAVRRAIGRAYRQFYGSRGRWRTVMRNVNRRNARQLARRACGKLLLGRSGIASGNPPELC